MAKSKTPAWIWIGCGCLLCILLIIAALGGLGFAGFTYFEGLVSDMADPESRTQAAMGLMGAETLPEGYRAHAFFRMPWIMDIVVLTDGGSAAETEGESFEEKAETLKNLLVQQSMMGPNLIVYLKLRGRGAEPLEPIISGRQRSNGANVDLGMELEAEERLGEGDLEVGSQMVRWRAHRGHLKTVDGRTPGIYAVLRIQCSEGSDRDLLWFQ
ncbi:MAG: hypothetical protein MI919_02585, partial [Holophagales bacterium]|nr:hypothetical protein [Holophagales bacterium]